MEEKDTSIKKNKLKCKKLNTSHLKQPGKLNSKIISNFQPNQKRQLRSSKENKTSLPLNSLNNIDYSPAQCKIQNLDFLSKAKTPLLYTNILKNINKCTPCQTTKRENKIIHYKLNTNPQRKTYSFMSGYENSSYQKSNDSFHNFNININKINNGRNASVNENNYKCHDNKKTDNNLIGNFKEKSTIPNKLNKNGFELKNTTINNYGNSNVTSPNNNFNTEPYLNLNDDELYYYEYNSDKDNKNNNLTENQEYSEFIKETNNFKKKLNNLIKYQNHQNFIHSRKSISINDNDGLTSNSTSIYSNGNLDKNLCLSYNKKIFDLKDELIKMKTALKEQMDLNKDLKSSYNKLLIKFNLNNKELEKLQTVQKENNEIEKQLKNTSNNLEFLKKQCEYFIKQNENLQNSDKENKKIIEQLKNKNTDFDLNEINKLKEFKNKYNTLVEEYVNQVKKNENLTKLNNEYIEKKKNNDLLENQIQVLNSKNQKLSNQITELKNRNKILINKNEELLKKNNTFRQINKKRNNSVKSLFKVNEMQQNICIIADIKKDKNYIDYVNENNKLLNEINNLKNELKQKCMTKKTMYKIQQNLNELNFIHNKQTKLLSISSEINLHYDKFKKIPELKISNNELNLVITPTTSIKNIDSNAKLKSDYKDMKIEYNDLNNKLLANTTNQVKNLNNLTKNDLIKEVVTLKQMNDDLIKYKEQNECNILSYEDKIQELKNELLLLKQKNSNNIIQKSIDINNNVNNELNEVIENNEQCNYNILNSTEKNFNKNNDEENTNDSMSNKKKKKKFKKKKKLKTCSELEQQLLDKDEIIQVLNLELNKIKNDSEGYISEINSLQNYIKNLEKGLGVDEYISNLENLLKTKEELLLTLSDQIKEYQSKCDDVILGKTSYEKEEQISLLANEVRAIRNRIMNLINFNGRIENFEEFMNIFEDIKRNLENNEKNKVMVEKINNLIKVYKHNDLIYWNKLVQEIFGIFGNENYVSFNGDDDSTEEKNIINENLEINKNDNEDVVKKK